MTSRVMAWKLPREEQARTMEYVNPAHRVPDPPSSTSSRGGAQPVPMWVRELVRLMDSAYRVPGTDIRIGLDPLLGFFLPGAGDVLGAIPSMLILTLAVQRGVPPVIVLRMLLNVAVDSLVGAVPLLGDLFDAAYRSNDKNLALLERHTRPGRRPGAGDYFIVGIAITLVGALALLPLLLVAVLAKMLFS